MIIQILHFITSYLHHNANHISRDKESPPAVSRPSHNPATLHDNPVTIHDNRVTPCPRGYDSLHMWGTRYKTPSPPARPIKGASPFLSQYPEVMRTSIALLSFCAVALGKRRPDQEDGSLTFSGLEVVQACTAGTPLGAKLSSALVDCSGNPEVVKPEMEAVARRRGGRRPGRGGRRPGGRGPRCPTAQKVKAKMAAKMTGDVCVLRSLGWLDGEAKETNDTMAIWTEDVMSLPAEVSSQLSEDAIMECAKMIGDAMASKPGIKR